MGRIIRGMTVGTFRNTCLTVLLMAVGAGDRGLMSCTLCINLAHYVAMAAGTELTRYLTALIFDHLGRVRSMTLETVCIGHGFGVWTVTLQAVEEGLML